MSSNPFSRYFEGLKVDATPRSAQEWTMLAPEERLGKFFLANVEDEHLLNAFRELLHSAIDRGISDAEFADEAWTMLDFLRQRCEMPTVDFMPRGLDRKETRAYQKDVTRIDSLARLQLIFRTQSDLAAGWREAQMAFDPVRLQRYPGWRFVRQPGARIKRKDHVEHEDEVRLKTDYEFWMARNSPDQGGFNQPIPPFGYNSWMVVQEVSREECEALGLLAPGEPVRVPAEYARFGIMPTGSGAAGVSLGALLGNSAVASVRGLPDEAKQRIVERCAEAGAVVVEDDGEMRLDREMTRLLREVDSALGGEPDWFADVNEILDGFDDVDAARLRCNQFVKDPACKRSHGARGKKKKRTDWQSEGLASLDKMPADVCAEASSMLETLEKINVVKVKGKPGEKPAFKQKKTLFLAKTYNGGELVIDAGTINHVINDHVGEESDFRMRHFPKVLATLKNPLEVWRQPSGARVFVGVFVTKGESGKVAVAVVEKEHHEGRVYTFFCNSDAKTINRQRIGEKVYSRNKNRQR